MSSGSSSPTKVQATGAGHPLVRNAHDAIVIMYSKKRPRVTQERDRFIKGCALLDAAVVGCAEHLPPPTLLPQQKPTNV